MYDLQAFTTPARIYHAPGQMYYFRGDDWYGVEALEAALTPRRRSTILHIVRGATGLVVTGGSIYGHRKKGVDWYCSILASMVWGGLAAEIVTRVTGLIMEAAQPEGAGEEGI